MPQASACALRPGPNHLCGANARASCAVPRANSARKGILRAVAGRIIKNAARKNNQFSPTAAAAANIVVITSVAKLKMAIMTCLLSGDLAFRTIITNLNLLIEKDLQERKPHESVGPLTHRVPRDAPLKEAQPANYPFTSHPPVNPKSDTLQRGVLGTRQQGSRARCGAREQTG